MNDKELRLAPLLKLIAEPIILLSSTGTVLWANRAALLLYGWKSSHIIGKCFAELLEKDHLPSPLPETLAFPCQNIGLMETTETFFEATNKTIEWKLSAYELDSKKQGILLLGRDVTEICRAEDKIFELDSIIAQTPGNLYWFDKNNVYLGCNDQSAKILGMSRQEAVGKDFKLLMNRLKSFDHTISEILVSQGQEVIRTGEPLLNVEEPPSEDDDGVLRHYLANKVPLFDRRGNVYGAIGISIDITDRKELEAKLLTEKEKAEAASRSKSEFIANMSHDIRTPIAGMLAMNQKLLDELHRTKSTVSQSPAQATALLTQLLATLEQDQPLLMGATNELLALCNDILESVKSDAGKASEQIENFELGAVLAHIVTLLRPVAQDKQLTLSCHVDANVPCHLTGIRLYLSRILINLTSNALKFTDQGFVKISVTLAEEENLSSAFAPGDFVKITCRIEDSGMGIPRDKQEVIFEHFSRLTQSYEGKYAGTGLGLYTVKRYVETLGGHIKVDSDVGKGSAFIVTLPFTVEKANDATTAQSCAKSWVHVPSAPFSVDGQTTTIPLVNETQPVGQRIVCADPRPLASSSTDEAATGTILVVEDNALAAMGLERTLHPFHCSVDIARNGAQALEKVKKGQYQLVFMDVGLPDFSGVEATKRIRQLSNTKQANVPIVGLTGHAGDPHYREACLKAGMQAVLNKPANPREIGSVLKIYLPHPTHTPDSHPGGTGSAGKHRPPKFKVIDREACVQLCEGEEELLQQMLSALTADLNTAATALAQGYANRDTAALRAELHRLQGGVSYLKLPQLEHCLQAFNAAVKADPQDALQLQATYQALSEAIAILCDTIENQASLAV